MSSSRFKKGRRFHLTECLPINGAEVEVMRVTPVGTVVVRFIADAKPYKAGDVLHVAAYQLTEEKPPCID